MEISLIIKVPEASYKERINLNDMQPLELNKKCKSSLKLSFKSGYDNKSRPSGIVVSDAWGLAYSDASPLVRLVEGEEKWEAPDPPSRCSPSKSRDSKLNRTVICMVLKATANDSRTPSPLP
ncbi:hypothetical protein TNCV_1256911 [Trichonephila clavipes]|nr:hypothetical protein TNCV_1256911 [Trichonephila clavipes]